MGRIRIMTGLLCLALASGLVGGAPASAVTGYSIHDFSELAAIDLATGDFVVVGDLGIVQGSALAAAAGDLFAVTRGLPTSSLYRVDRETAAATLVGDIGDIGSVTDLTFDAGGSLWLATNAALYRVDPASGAPTLIGAPDQTLWALAARDSELYGIVRIGPDFGLVSVDPITAATNLIALLPELDFGAVATGLDSMSFDGSGALWVSVLVDPPVTPPQVSQHFFRIADPEAPVAEEIFSTSAAPQLRFTGLAVAPGVFDSAVEIPALGRFGWAVLAALLLGAGLLALRR